MSRQYATIINFNNSTGFGFARLDDVPTEGRDVAIHHSEVEAEGYVALYEGDKLVLDVEETEKGLRGRHVRRRSFV